MMFHIIIMIKDHFPHNHDHHNSQPSTTYLSFPGHMLARVVQDREVVFRFIFNIIVMTIVAIFLGVSILVVCHP